MHAGRLSLDGDRIIPVDSDVIKDRNRIAYNGVAVLSLVINHSGKISKKPKLTTHGLVETEEHISLLKDIITQIEDELNNMNDSDIADDIKVTEMARIIVRRYFRESQRKRPLTSVHLIRVDDSNF